MPHVHNVDDARYLLITTHKGFRLEASVGKQVPSVYFQNFKRAAATVLFACGLHLVSSPPNPSEPGYSAKQIRERSSSHARPPAAMLCFLFRWAHLARVLRKVLPLAATAEEGMDLQARRLLRAKAPCPMGGHPKVPTLLPVRGKPPASQDIKDVSFMERVGQDILKLGTSAVYPSSTPHQRVRHVFLRKQPHCKCLRNWLSTRPPGFRG